MFRNSSKKYRELVKDTPFPKTQLIWNSTFSL